MIAHAGYCLDDLEKIGEVKRLEEIAKSGKIDQPMAPRCWSAPERVGVAADAGVIAELLAASKDPELVAAAAAAASKR